MNKLSAYISGPAGLFLFVFFFIPWVSITCAIPFLLEETSVMNASGFELATGQSADEFAQESCALVVDYGAGDSIAGLAGGWTQDNAFGSDVLIDGEPSALFNCDGITFDAFFASTATTDVTAAVPVDPAESTASDLDPNEFEAIQADATLWAIPLIALLAMGLAAGRYVNVLSGTVGGTVMMVLAIAGGAVLALKYLEFRDLADYLTTLSQDTSNDVTDTGESSLTVEGLANLNYEPGWYVAILSLLTLFAAGAVGLFEDEVKPAPQPQTMPQPDMSMFANRPPAQQPPTGGPSQPNDTPKRPSWME